MPIPHLDCAAWLRRLPSGPGPCLALYSTAWGGIVTDPRLMQIPLDDHMVHRGDAVFEAFRCIAGAFYNLDAHLNRLQESAAEIRLRPPLPRARLLAALRAAVRAGGRRNCVVRVFFSRGPGSFSVNPLRLTAVT